MYEICSRRPHSSRGTNNIGEYNGRRGGVCYSEEQKEHNISNVWEYQTPGIYGVEESKIKSVKIESSNVPFGIYKREKHNAIFFKSSTVFNEILQFNFDYGEEENMRRIIGYDNTSGYCCMVHGRREYIIEKKQHDNINSFVFSDRESNNSNLVTGEIRDKCEDIRRSSMQEILPTVRCIGTKENDGINTSTYTRVNDVQNISSKMFTLQETNCIESPNTILLKGMQDGEIKGNGIKIEILSDKDNLWDMWERKNNTEKKRTFESGGKIKNLFKSLCKGVEAFTQKRLQEKEKVYNIEVEDNNNYFVNGFLVHNCDEFSFVRNAQSIMSAVEYFHIEGGQMNMLSTVWGRNNLFWKVWDDREVFASWDRHYVGLFTDMTNFDVKVSLVDQISKYKLKLNAPWQNIDKLEKKRWEDSPNAYSNFLQETAGVPFDEATSAISQELLDTFTMDYALVEERPPGDDGKDKIYIISADFGSERNVTALIVFEAIDGRMVVVNTVTLIGNIDEQMTRIVDVFDRYNPKFFLGDGTGMGGKAFTDILSNRMGEGVVISINYSKKDLAMNAGVDMNNKNFFVTKMIKLMSQGNIIVPKNHKRLREEILSVEKIVYEKSVKYSGKNGLVGSDDMAMAFLQGSVIFEQIFGEYGESGGFADAGKSLSWEAVRGRSRPVVHKKEFCEVASGGRDIKPNIIHGFGKLI